MTNHIRTGIGMSATNDSVDLLPHAVAFAADKHRNQRRKDAAAAPYINHMIALANVLKQEGGVDDVTVLATATILHDTIEDTETTEAELRQLFGDEITGIVLEVTDTRTWRRQRGNSCRLSMPRMPARRPS
jgi:GTP diphosphokinase / guanosine-3',5'-bis(diphosphate) 3'-diphosphatase